LCEEQTRSQLFTLLLGILFLGRFSYVFYKVVCKEIFALWQGRYVTATNAISGDNNCTIQFHAKLFFPSPANLHLVPCSDTMNVTEGSKHQAGVVGWRNRCNAWQCCWSFRLRGA